MFRSLSVKKAIEKENKKQHRKSLFAVADSIATQLSNDQPKKKKTKQKKRKSTASIEDLSCTPNVRRSEKRKKSANNHSKALEQSTDPISLDSAFHEFNGYSRDSFSDDSVESAPNSSKQGSFLTVPDTPLLLPQLNQLRLNTFIVHSPAFKMSKKKKLKENICIAPAGPFDDADAFDFIPGLLMYDSEAEAQAHFAWLTMPVTPKDFFSTIWENNFLFIERKSSEYYSALFSSDELFEAMQNHHLDFATNINLARYINHQRETLNPTGRAFASVVKDYYENQGCSVQFINPQAYCDKIWTLCDRLQELFGCFVGANTYLTPPATQGFAPHWDEIDAFILQLEGRKHWKVYQYKKSENPENLLPRESSRNFTDADLKDWTLVHDGWLNAGDMLYMPRGFIHQGYTDSEVHSFHVTISVGRKHSYADLYEKIVPDALRSAIESFVEFRHSLPIDMLSRSGVSQDGDNLIQSEPDYWDKVESTDRIQPSDLKEPFQKVTKDRHLQFYRHCQVLNDRLSTEILKNIDPAVDMQALESMQTMLPPTLTETEKANSIYGCNGLPKFEATTPVKFIRRHGQRLIYEDETTMRLEHRYHNSRIFEERTVPPIDINPDMIYVVKDLLASYPHYKTIADLDPETPMNIKTETIELLYKNGLLMTEPTN